jgi:hypothetical protein
MKIGSYQVPKNGLEKMLKATKKIYGDYGSKVISRDDIGAALGHKSLTSGAVGQKIADMRAYGLLEGKEDKNRVSKLGKDATYGTSEEKNIAIEKAIHNIPLWAKFLEDFGPDAKEKDFWIKLRKITGAESPDAQTKAADIRNAYMADVRLIKNIGEPLERVQDQDILDRGNADRTSTMQAQHMESKIPTIIIDSREVRFVKPAKDRNAYLKELEKLKSLADLLYEEEQDQGNDQNKADNDNEEQNSIAHEPYAQESEE